MNQLLDKVVVQLDKQPSPQAIEIAARMLAARAMRESATHTSTTMLSPSEIASLRLETRLASEQMRAILASRRMQKQNAESSALLHSSPIHPGQHQVPFNAQK